MPWRFVQWMCGIHKRSPEKMTREERKEVQKQLTNIQENDRTSKLLDAGAILLATLTAFLLGFYDSR